MNHWVNSPVVLTKLFSGICIGVTTPGTVLSDAVVSTIIMIIVTRLWLTGNQLRTQLYSTLQWLVINVIIIILVIMILIYSIRTTLLKAELALATMGSNYFSRKKTHTLELFEPLGFDRIFISPLSLYCKI